MARTKTKVYDANDTLFSSDPHYFHGAMIRSRLRKFATIEEMNEALIANWNNKVDVNDNVFLLGDVSFVGSAKTIEVLGQLNGNIHLIEGNHDKGLSDDVRKMFTSVQHYLEIDVLYGTQKQRICLSHFPFRSWNRMHYGSWMLHGHSHGTMPPFGLSYDVGVDNNYYRPVSARKIAEIMRHKKFESLDQHQPKESNV